MRVDMDTGVRYIKGVGEARMTLMAKLGIQTVRELLCHFPRAYEDRTQFKRVCELEPGETACVITVAAEEPRLSHVRKGLDLVKLRVVDDSGSIDITFFNQSFVKNAIERGEVYVFYGKNTGTVQRPAMVNPLFEPEPRAGVLTGRIMPVYRLTAGLSQRNIADAVRRALDECADTLPDVLPERVAREYELCKARFAYENIHFPETAEALDIARRRLIFEEFFILSSAMKLIRSKHGERAGRVIETPDFDRFYEKLPFEPTKAQKRAIAESAGDMSGEKVMNRLVQGDVGSGKTLIAAGCCWMVWCAGYQSAFMAPTELLASQHYETLKGLLEQFGMRIGLLKGSMTAKQKRQMHEKLKAGEIDLAVGTHALLSDDVGFNDLALVVTDEQHRFGVSQRSLLTSKGESPHVLVMSATPIPRTLALIIYGDLDVSIVDEMPPGRQSVDAFVVDERHRQRVYDFIRKLVGEGRQVFVICPAVEEGNIPDEGLKAAREYSVKLQNEIFPELVIKLVHGKMPAKEKDGAMRAFARGEADILVATTVVEVGVDVPNAALIVIENADRFGLSQLHQLRGRVGRGEHKSYCVMFRSTNGDAARERLEAIRATNDGFIIAERDLKLRGPGDFFGSRQHGLPEMKTADFGLDMTIISRAQTAADAVLESDPDLSFTENRKLKEHIERLFLINADKLN